MARGGARKGAGRRAGTTTEWSPEQIERFRGRIQTNSIIQRLNKIALGETEGDPTSCRVALGLLDKVLPSLSASQSTVTHKRDVAEMTDDEIAERLGQIGGARTPADAAKAPLNPSKLN